MVFEALGNVFSDALVRSPIAFRPHSKEAPHALRQRFFTLRASPILFTATSVEIVSQRVAFLLASDVALTVPVAILSAVPIAILRLAVPVAVLPVGSGLVPGFTIPIPLVRRSSDPSLRTTIVLAAMPELLPFLLCAFTPTALVTPVAAITFATPLSRVVAVSSCLVVPSVVAVLHVSIVVPFRPIRMRLKPLVLPPTTLDALIAIPLCLAATEVRTIVPDLAILPSALPLRFIFAAVS